MIAAYCKTLQTIGEGSYYANLPMFIDIVGKYRESIIILKERVYESENAVRRE